jgi:hypothetical protein
MKVTPPCRCQPLLYRRHRTRISLALQSICTLTVCKIILALRPRYSRPTVYGMWGGFQHAKIQGLQPVSSVSLSVWLQNYSKISARKTQCVICSLPIRSSAPHQRSLSNEFGASETRGERESWAC